MARNKMPSILVCLIAVFTILVSCGYARFEDQFEVTFFRKVARESHDDGWVFTFVCNGYKDKEKDDSNLVKFQFYGLNQRYRYNDAYIRNEIQTTPNGATQSATVIPACLTWGTGSDAEKRDMQLIQSIINASDVAAEKLLALNPDDYSFEVMDKELFFSLMMTALTSEPQKEGTDITYWDKPTHAFLAEPIYIDGYKFQVCFMQETGCVDELYIDILYQTGNGYKDYIQLSDLIDSKNATADQLRAFELIQNIVTDIKNAESFVVNKDTYQNVTIGEIDFSRLYTFLEKIHTNNYEQYIVESIIEFHEGDDSND